MADELDREEWEALHALARESPTAPAREMLSRLKLRGLVDLSLNVTDAGRAAVEAYAGVYPPRDERRDYIGSGR